MKHTSLYLRNEESLISEQNYCFKMFLIVFLQFIPHLFCQEFPLTVNIENEVVRCDAVDACTVDCDYGFISNGSYFMSVDSIESTFGT